METISILAIVLAIAATVLAFIFIVPEKKRASLNQIGKIIHDILNFKFLVIEKVLQALYIFSTATVILYGFFMLFYVEKGYSNYYYSTPSRWYGGYGLLLMILGPIAVRIAYEALMMAILLIKNVIQINNKIKNDNDDNNGNDVFATPIAPVKEAPVAPVAPAAPAAPAAPVAPVEPVANNTCANCGNTVDPNSTFCPYCGTKRQ